MYSFLVWILPIIFVLLEFVWYVTSTEHKYIPMILVLLDVAIAFIPVIGWFVFVGNIFIIIDLIENNNLELKDNWFNRNFLAYHEK